jgi:hypothetical protein
VFPDQSDPALEDERHGQFRARGAIKTRSQVREQWIISARDKE